MTASSSFIELKTSRPPSFHSPLSVVNIDEVRTHPCTEVASSLMNASVFYKSSMSRWARSAVCIVAYSDIVETPFDALFGDSLSLGLPAKRSYTFSCNVDVGVCLPWRPVSAGRSLGKLLRLPQQYPRPLLHPGVEEYGTCVGRSLRAEGETCLRSRRRKICCIESRLPVMLSETSASRGV